MLLMMKEMYVVQKIHLRARIISGDDRVFIETGAIYGKI